MRRLTLAIAILAAAPAFAQPQTDWTKPVAGVDAPAASAPRITTQVSDLIGSATAAEVETPEELALRWEREQALIVYRVVSPEVASILAIGPADIVADADAPLPPPCEPPLPRSPTSPPGPPSPAPAPCRP